MSETDFTADRDELFQLNTAYIDSVRKSDADRFREILSDDFLCTLPDGTLVDKPQFLARTSASPPLQKLDAHDIDVRLIGNVAIIHARTTFTLNDGTSGSGRYTDIWARRDGKWLAVAAHVTRR